MARAAVPRTDLLLSVMGAAHESDRATSVLRLVQAVLDRGSSVQVWACGFATTLTTVALGRSKPRNVAALSMTYPTTAALVGGLLAGHPDRLFWYGCGMCCAERGTTDQIDGVVVRPAARYAEHVAAAGRTVLVGVI